MGMGDLRRQAGLLAAGHQMVDEDAQAGPGRGPEVGDDPGQVVDAVQPFDDHALDPQIVAPDPLDQLGVVDALDEDAAGPGHPRPLAGPRPAIPMR